MIWLFAATLLVHVAYWVLLGSGLGRLRSEHGERTDDAVPISVIVAARDEASRLAGLFGALRGQTHDHFEVLVVDDGSTDDTAEVVAAQAARDSRVRLIRSAEPAGKKRALAAGVAAAAHERLAFTDADCEPRPGWLAAIATRAASEPEAVLVGYGPLRVRPGLLNSLVRYETLVTALMTAGSIGLGRPYMAVGRNFSYPKSLFQQVGGFDEHLHSLSGDDDLLVQQARRAGAAVRYVLDEQGFVESDAPASWRQWLGQKLRHTSAGRHYEGRVKAHLAAFHVTGTAVWLAPLVLGWVGAAFLAARFLVQRVVLKRAADAFHAEHDLMIYQPLLDFGYLLYTILLAPAGVLFGGRRW